MARLFPEDGSHEPKRAKLDRSMVMGFSDEDKIGTIQPSGVQFWGLSISSTCLVPP